MAVDVEELGTPIGMQRQLFARLIAGFLHHKPNAPAPKVVSYQNLLRGFLDRAATARVTERESIMATQKICQNLLESFRCINAAEDEKERDRASDFDLLRVLGLAHAEVRHSMVLAWLLDRSRHQHGTHAQQSLGFRLLLEEVGLPVMYADAPYKVFREVAGNESRVDVEIRCRKGFLIHIENKIYAAEGEDQTGREWRDICRRAAAFEVPSACVHAFFLTPTGKPAQDFCFRPLSWSRIAKVAERFAEQARPPDVRLFAAHYARSVRRFAAEERSTDGQGISQRRGAVPAGALGAGQPVGGGDGRSPQQVQDDPPAGSGHVDRHAPGLE